MTLLSVLMIGIGLSMDAFAVAVAKGMCTRGGKTITTALYLAFFFGLFQARCRRSVISPVFIFLI